MNKQLKVFFTLLIVYNTVSFTMDLDKRYEFPDSCVVKNPPRFTWTDRASENPGLYITSTIADGSLTIASFNAMIAGINYMHLKNKFTLDAEQESALLLCNRHLWLSVTFGLIHELSKSVQSYFNVSIDDMLYKNCPALTEEYMRSCGGVVKGPSGHHLVYQLAANKIIPFNEACRAVIDNTEPVVLEQPLPSDDKKKNILHYAVKFNNIGLAHYIHEKYPLFCMQQDSGYRKPCDYAQQFPLWSFLEPLNQKK